MVIIFVFCCYTVAEEADGAGEPDFRIPRCPRFIYVAQHIPHQLA